MLEECAAPAQIIFASSNFCSIFNLAFFLELHYPVDKNESREFNLISAIGKTATRAKQKVGRHLKTKIFNSTEFKDYWWRTLMRWLALVVLFVNWHQRMPEGVDVLVTI